ncbi:EthD domain-containing protein [Thioclava sp. GXIMD2076]|uniref:EthD domain-containing protein n=1 Tax=Thioclava kandeliae TaxID=3070818 RepID=A0ABV1SLH1_9RHOB
MYSVAMIFRRKPGMSLEEFQAYYRDRHGPLMLEHITNRGLISYEHFPAASASAGARYVTEGDLEYDAISIYSFETEQQAEECWAIPEVMADSAKFIDFETMISLPLSRRAVFPKAN